MVEGKGTLDKKKNFIRQMQYDTIYDLIINHFNLMVNINHKIEDTKHYRLTCFNVSILTGRSLRT